MPDERANPPAGSWSAAVQAGYLGVGVDPTPNLNYTVAGVVVPLPTPESQFKQIRRSQYAITRAAVAGDSPAVPTAGGLFPASAPVAGPDVIVTVTGSSFDLRSVIKANGVEIATLFINAGALEGTLRSAGAVPGVVALTVYTSPPGGGTSGPANFTWV